MRSYVQIVEIFSVKLQRMEQTRALYFVILSAVPERKTEKIDRQS